MFLLIPYIVVFTFPHNDNLRSMAMWSNYPVCIHVCLWSVLPFHHPSWSVIVCTIHWIILDWAVRDQSMESLYKVSASLSARLTKRAIHSHAHWPHCSSYQWCHQWALSWVLHWWSPGHLFTHGVCCDRHNDTTQCVGYIILNRTPLINCDNYIWSMETVSK